MFILLNVDSTVTKRIKHFEFVDASYQNLVQHCACIYILKRMLFSNVRNVLDHSVMLTGTCFVSNQ